MRPLKLHTKTTLLACGVTLAVLGVVLALVSIRVAGHLREEQKALAELQAVSLAEHISGLSSPRDPQELARAATLAQDEAGIPGGTLRAIRCAQSRRAKLLRL